MSNRYGRNQRRKHREQVIERERIHLAEINEWHQRLDRVKSREASLIARHAEEIKAARMARDSIRITVDDLLDPADQRIQMRARFELVGAGREPLYAAANMDSRQDMLHRSDTERQAFTSLVGRHVAEYALAAIMRHWRSR